MEAKKELRQVMAYLPQELFEKFRTYGFNHKMNFQQMIRTALREYLDKEKK